MFRPHAQVGHSPVVVLAPALLLSLLLGLSGCGSESNDDQADEPSKSALACREKWKDLEAELDGRDAKTNPSALARRWDNIGATVDYYAQSATGKDCDEAIEAQEKAMEDLTAFAKKLAPFDLELKLEQVEAGAEAYAAAPRPPAPSPSPAKGEKKKPKKKPAANPAPKPADIAAALKTLTQQAPLATQQQGPAWTQANVVDLASSTAVAKTLKDLAFLSSESAAYGAGQAALTQIQAALLAATK